jgi:hypothetical protein
MTRRWLVATAAVVALAGCSASGGPDDAPRPAGAGTPVSTPADETSGPSAGGTTSGADADPAAFVAAVRDRLPEIAADRRDEEIGDVARQACAGLAAGTEADRIVAGTRSLGTLDAEATDQATARELVKLAIDTVCPGQAGRVDEF